MTNKYPTTMLWDDYPISPISKARMKELSKKDLPTLTAEQVAERLYLALRGVLDEEMPQDSLQ